MGTQIKQYETYPLYLILSTITCALLTAVLGFLMYVLEPGLLQLHPIAPVMSSIVLSILIGIIWLLCLSLIVATLGIIRLHPIVLRLANQFIYGLFPLTLAIGKVRGVTKDQLRQSMIDLINRRVGQDKAIPQMLLVGASADDTIAITLFTTFLGIYFNTGSISTQLLMIPVTLVLSIGVGYLVFKLTRGIIEHVSNDYLKVMIAFGLCLAMRAVEKYGHVEIFNSLLTVMVFGFFIRNYIVDSSKIILDKMNLIWKTGKLYLFAFVGMAINPTLVGKFFLIGVGILSCSLFVRSIGVLISLIGTNLSLKERIFCVIAYLPKATVQSAKAAIPMQMGVVGGEIMQAIAILSVLITAPIGAIGIKLTSDKLLKTEN